MTAADSLPHPRTDAAPTAAVAPHEHAWRTRSRHATSEGWVLYVRCVTCGAWRVDASPSVLVPPAAVSAPVTAPAPGLGGRRDSVADMDRVRLTGRLLCRTPSEAAVVAAQLPAHVTATQAEPGCLSFAVTPTTDPLVWDVAELFDGAEAFAHHQRRVAASEWGRATAGIPRDYRVETVGTAA